MERRQDQLQFVSAIFVGWIAEPTVQAFPGRVHNCHEVELDPIPEPFEHGADLILGERIGLHHQEAAVEHVGVGARVGVDLERGRAEEGTRGDLAMTLAVGDPAGDVLNIRILQSPEIGAARLLAGGRKF